MNNAEALKLCAGSSRELADFLCWQFNKKPLWELRRWFETQGGDAVFLQFVEAMSEVNLKIRPSTLGRTILKYRIASAYRAFNLAFKRKDFQSGRNLERHFGTLVGIKERAKPKQIETRIKSARKYLADVIRATRWADRLRKLDQKKPFIGADDLRSLDYGGQGHVGDRGDTCPERKR